jgi:hypothetical protein
MGLLSHWRMRVALASERVRRPFDTYPAAEAARQSPDRYRAAEAGTRLRLVLEPVARELGVDYDRWHGTPPRSDPEVVMSAMWCGANLLVPFVYPNIWPVDDVGRGISKPDAEKAEGCLEEALHSKQGRDAISMMAQGYGRALAAQWRTAAEMDEYRDAADRLRKNAAASEQLADLVASIWPVRGYEAALEQVARADVHRLVDEYPNAMIDLRDYALKTHAIAEALAVAMSARFDEFADAILGPLYEVHPRYMLAQGSNWTGNADSWSNLLRTEPASQREVDQAYMESARGDFDSPQA